MERGESCQVAPRAGHTMVVVRVVPGVVVACGSGESLALDLGSGLGQHRDVAAAVVAVDARRVVRLSERGVRVRRGDVGRAQGRAGGRADGLGRRRRSHHALMVQVRG